MADGYSLVTRCILSLQLLVLGDWIESVLIKEKWTNHVTAMQCLLQRTWLRYLLRTWSLRLKPTKDRQVS